ncbi:MAG: S-adenosylmethionine:tRNA ribosyltransferase-isomerase, partial [Deltaproteobacteria bacterium]|nr:S-adenosylmethionine:tRNA ribosyltransferase-isomerase [Deltaproteobacteria bacterium]
MELKDFDFPLPEELIAQFPLKERDSSRLMVLSRTTGEVSHRGFKDLKEYLRAGDILILNDTKVFPARLIGGKPTGGKVELLLVKKLGEGADTWSCLIKNSKGLSSGSR